jgi:hypothetical protein
MAHMANGSSIDVEASLAKAVRNYLLAEPNERISEDENLRPVCQWLARLLLDLLRCTDGWNQYASVDDVLPCTADRDSPNDLKFTGLLVWLLFRKRETGASTSRILSPVSSLAVQHGSRPAR